MSESVLYITANVCVIYMWPKEQQMMLLSKLNLLTSILSMKILEVFLTAFKFFIQR